MVETKRIHEDTHRGGPHRRPPAVNPGFHRTDLSSYAVRYYFAYCKVICECVCQSDLHMQSIFTFRYTMVYPRSKSLMSSSTLLFDWFMHACVCLCVCKYLYIQYACVCVCVFTAIWSEERAKIHSNYPSPVVAVLWGSVSWLCP